MKTLFALELKKLTKKRMNIIVITVCLILAGILFYLPVSQFIVLDTDGKQTSGMEAIAMDKEFSNSNAGKLTNEKIKADIAKYQALFDDPENVSKDATQKSLNDSAYFKYFFPYSDYWKLINGNYVFLGNNNKPVYLYPFAQLINKTDDYNSEMCSSVIVGDLWKGFNEDMGNVGKEGEIKYDNGKKPVRLVKNILKIIDDKEAIVLDFFSGSATTAHAVMKLNSEDGGSRKYICVQLEENLDETLEKVSGETKKSLKQMIEVLDLINKRHILSEVGKERIRRSGEKIQATNNANIDIGFKVFRTADTNIKWNSLMDMGQVDMKQLEYTPDLVDFMPDANDVDVVYELMLRQRDVALSETLEQLSDIGSRTYLYASSYLVCLETQITEELVGKLAELDPLPIKFIFRDSAFKDDIALKDETFRRLKALIEKNAGTNKPTYTVEFI